MADRLVLASSSIWLTNDSVGMNEKLEARTLDIFNREFCHGIICLNQFILHPPREHFLANQFESWVAVGPAITVDKFLSHFKASFLRENLTATQEDIDSQVEHTYLETGHLQVIKDIQDVWESLLALQSIVVLANHLLDPNIVPLEPLQDTLYTCKDSWLELDCCLAWEESRMICQVLITDQALGHLNTRWEELSHGSRGLVPCYLEIL